MTDIVRPPAPEAGYGLSTLGGYDYKGRPAAVILSPEDLESLEETLAVLSDPELMRRIREGEAALEYATAVIELLPAVAANPRRLGKPLKFELEGRWAARRGPYWVIYELDEGSRTVTVLAVAHRADVYRPR